MTWAGFVGVTVGIGIYEAIRWWVLRWASGPGRHKAGLR